MSHTIVAIYLKDKPTIQFGNYTRSAVALHEDFVALRTYNANDWAVSRLTDVVVNDQIKQVDGTHKVQFEPGYPLIYMPQADWNQLKPAF